LTTSHLLPKGRGRTPLQVILYPVRPREGEIALEVSSRNSRVAALQKRWDRRRAGLDLILDQRGADMADLSRRRRRAAGARLQGAGKPTGW
jgi:hypothetical protein